MYYSPFCSKKCERPPGRSTFAEQLDARGSPMRDQRRFPRADCPRHSLTQDRVLQKCRDIGPPTCGKSGGTSWPRLITGPLSLRKRTTYLAERATTSGLTPTLFPTLFDHRWKSSPPAPIVDVAGEQPGLPTLPQQVAWHRPFALKWYEWVWSWLPVTLVLMNLPGCVAGIIGVAVNIMVFRSPENRVLKFVLTAGIFVFAAAAAMVATILYVRAAS